MSSELPSEERELSAQTERPVQVPTVKAAFFGKYVLLVSMDVAAKAMRFLADTRLPRHFGEAVFGQLTLAQSISGQGLVIGSAGLDVAGVRNVAAGSAPTARVAATVLLLRAGLGIV